MFTLELDLIITRTPPMSEAGGGIQVMRTHPRLDKLAEQA
jgi:hypothetical protein